MQNISKKAQFDKFPLGIYSGIKFTLYIPNRNYKKTDKDNKYFIESYYNSKQKQHKAFVRDMYRDYLASVANNKVTPMQKLSDLKELYSYYISQIVTDYNIHSSDSISLNTNVISAINLYFETQKKQFEIGELVDITDYKDRNKKLNDYFNLEQNNTLTLKELTKDHWTNFRYFVLNNYAIKANSTVNQYITYIKSFYNWLIIDKEISIINHPLQLKKLDTSKQQAKYNEIPKALVDEYFEVLTKDDKYLRLYIISLLVFENAKRPVQIYKLQAKDIDLSNNTIYLHPKGRNKVKEITIITKELKEAIQKIYNNTLSHGGTIEPDDYLLGGRNMFKKGGKPLSQGDIRDTQIVKFREQYPKFKNLQVYSLKHTTITLVSQKDLKKAQKMANHTKQSTTEIYDRSKQISEAIPRKDLITKY